MRNMLSEANRLHSYVLKKGESGRCRGRLWNSEKSGWGMNSKHYFSPNCHANVKLLAKNRKLFDKSTIMDTEFQNEQPQTTTSPWTTLSIRQVYDNPWIQVTHRDVLNPAGGSGIYGVVHFKNIAVGIVPLDEHGNTWLVGQYRYVLERYSWEIPEGGGPLGTAPLDAAKRELQEETGIQATNWTKLVELYLSNSVTTEYAIAYIAQGLTFGDAQPEETELLKVRKLHFSQALQMVLDGEITDALSVAALLKTNELLRSGLLSV